MGPGWGVGGPQDGVGQTLRDKGGPQEQVDPPLGEREQGMWGGDYREEAHGI